MPIHLDSIPRRYVPGRGPVPPPSGIMFVGEAPGAQENALGWPFVGQSGDELESYLWWGAGLDRRDTYTTNLYKFWPLHDHRGKQLPPSPEQIRAGEPELLMELAIIKPRIVVAVGAHASRWFLGDRFQSLRRDHGLPRIMPNPGLEAHSVRLDEPFDIATLYEHGFIIVLPCTHPAAGLHQDRAQVDIKWDFDQLGRLIRGEIAPYPPDDEHPEPKYERIYDAADGANLTATILAGCTVVAIDTEGTIADPWCVTFSVRPGEAWLIRSTERESLAALDRHINAPSGMCTVITHYEAHDIPPTEAMGVRIAHKHRAINPDGSLTNRCTMSEAYLLGTEPKGLKPLAWRLAGMEMESYEELVGPTEQERSMAYIQGAFDGLKCSTCNGEGKVAKIGKAWMPVAGCARCGGSGLDPLGKSGRLLKKPRRCECCVEGVRELVGRPPCPAGCVDGLLVPLPDREFIFDAAKSDWRWKQPQSIARWIKRRIKAGGALEDWIDDDSLPTTVDAIVGTDPTIDDREEEPAHAYFKLRRDWGELSGRADKAFVEAIVGWMPRTTLSDVPDQDRVTCYACRDADATLRAASVTEPRLAALDLLPIREMDVAFVPMLSRMEQTGLLTNAPHFVALRNHCDERMDEIRAKLAGLIGERMNPNSDKLADVLFNKLGLPSIKLTKSGKRDAIDDDVLGALKARLRKSADGNSAAQLAIGIIDCITDYREVQKLRTGYVDPLLECVDSAGFIHTTLNYTTVATGRLSSSDPINLQTLPNPDNFSEDTPPDRNYGQRVRSGIVAGEGYKFVGVDYGQIEMVVGAHVTQDSGLLRIFREGLDVHYYVASMMFGYPYDPANGINEVPKRVRTQVKPINFGAFYGIGPDKLQMQLATLPSGAVEKTVDECQALLELYYDRLPGIMAWKERLWAEATETGYVRDMFGRVRWVPGLRSRIKKVRAAAEREAANMPIQSGANGIIRIASRGLWENELPAMWGEGMDVQPVMQTHDENVLRSRAEYAELVGTMVAGAMRNAVKLSVPIKAEAKIGDTLYDIK